MMESLNDVAEAFLHIWQGTDPNNAQESYFYMQGLDWFGDPYVDPTSGLPTTYVYNGDPVAGTGWLDAAPADRVMMGSFGPFDMNPGDSQYVLIKMAVGQGDDNLAEC